MKHSTSKQRVYGMFLVAFLLILSACSSSKSDADLPPPPAGPAALLVAHPWELEAAGFDDDSSGRIEPNENTLLACQQDNTIRFFPDGSGRTDDNADACTPDSTSSVFEWEYSAPQNLLLIGGTPLKIADISKQFLCIKMDEYLTVPFLVEYRAVE